MRSWGRRHKEAYRDRQRLFDRSGPTGSLVGIEFGGLRRSAEHSEVESRKETLKTEFRAKDAKNAKKLLQGEFVEFVYKSFDVTFEELTAKVYQ
jgi:hypothetical protein